MPETMPETIPEKITHHLHDSRVKGKIVAACGKEGTEGLIPVGAWDGTRRFGDKSTLCTECDPFFDEILAAIS